MSGSCACFCCSISKCTPAFTGAIETDSSACTRAKCVSAFGPECSGATDAFVQSQFTRYAPPPPVEENPGGSPSLSHGPLDQTAVIVGVVAVTFILLASVIGYFFLRRQRNQAIVDESWKEEAVEAAKDWQELQWKEIVDGQTGKVYYWNTATGETTWEDPDGESSEDETLGSSPDIRIGTTVTIKGLSKRPDLNGKRGKCTKYDTKTARYLIQLDQELIIKVKSENLEILISDAQMPGIVPS
ncbi:hypothetical protein CYMTET_20257 [Cymbomonas tetramitiformis]|uniref:WW domain-containing protein n=1 Tax=Cymbomonas tetramitiformis TaxID=36881 RepID=A0AAE0G5R8_9CHLO|nr:hypothetical protein CYMTET_20257 [Cymbomonas tetramitiformis]